MKRLKKSVRRSKPRGDGDTEARILDAAHAVFLRRGTAGARMQEIAGEAGVNQALLHYYYRNKEQLAQAAFERAAKGFMPAVVQVLTSEGELEDKVRRVIDLELGHLARAPYLPGYIIGEVTHHPDRAAPAPRRRHRAGAPRISDRASSARCAGRSRRASRPARCDRSRRSRSSST